MGYYDGQPREHVFDKLRKLFTGGGVEARKPGDRGANRAVRPATPRRRPGSKAGRPGHPGNAAGLEAGVSGVDSSRQLRGASGPISAGEPSVGGVSGAGSLERTCPHCGALMLAGWGSTCGKCRPTLVAPKTLFFAASDLSLPTRPGPALTLGWLVVVRTTDEQQQGRLLELDRPTVALSRAGVPPLGADKVLQFGDNLMSSGHATIRGPSSPERTGAFTVADRENPSPSANGTFVNAHRLAPGEVLPLSDGDMLKVGATELLFKTLWLPPTGHNQ